MTAHKHAALMAQYAQDALESETPWEKWEISGQTSGRWYPLHGQPTWTVEYEYRRKPKTLTHTVTIPEPVREAPEVGTYLFLAFPHAERLHCTFRWDGAEATGLWLKRGLCFSTEEDAIAAAKAMMPLKGE